MEAPHFLRFARALALGTTVTVAAGCASSTSPDGSADVASADSTAMDSTTPADVNPCSTCECVGLVPPDASAADSGRASCESLGLVSCCAAVGPLPPPELSA